VSNEYTPAAGWATPQLFDVDATQGGFSPKVAISPDGRATVVWYQYVRGTGRIFSSQYTSGNGWSAAVALDAASSAPGSFNPHIAFDHNGNGYVLWQQWWHGVTLIWGNRYMSDRGWIAPQIIQSDRTAFSDEPQFAFDGNGNAMAIWPQSGEIFSSRYMRDQGWSTSLDISDGIEGVRPTIDVNASGDAFVAWTQVVVTGTDAHGIPRTRGIDWSARYTIADGWEAPTLLQDPNGFDSGNVSLAVDDAGNAIAAWSEFNGSFYRIYTNRYLVASGWIGRKVIDTTNTVGASKPHVAVDATGNAVAVWEQTDAVGNTGIWSSRFE